MALPQGWLLADMAQIVKWGSGGTPKSDNPRYYNGTIPWIIIGDMNDALVTASEKHITRDGLENSSAKYVEVGSVLLAMYGSIGKLGIAGVRLTTNQAIAFTSKLYGIENKYLFYWLMSQRSKLLSMGKGGTQKNISQTVINTLKVPLPPLPEQHRIVAKIDALFSELDKGVEVLQTLRAQLRTYRQAVLKWAFEGTLTGIVLEQGILKNQIEKPRYGTSKKCSYDVCKTIVIRIPNIDHALGRVDYTDTKYASFTSDEIEPLRLRAGDILIIRSNGSASLVGRAALIKEHDTDNLFAGYLMRLRIADNNLQPQFLLHYLASPAARIFIENKAKSTSGVHNINSDEIASLPIPLCSLTEQAKIVAAIESRLSVCDKLEQLVGENLDKAQALRQSILKKAFAGELVPQDPNYEPAEKLLERIKAMKADATNTTATRRARK
jgi:type I restriction enzyme, S subunit